MERMTQNDLNEKLVSLIEKYSTKHDFEVNPGDDLYKDHGLYGDDVDDFFNEYVAAFNVDLSSFDAGEFFPDEGDMFIDSIVSLFRKAFSFNRLEIKIITVMDLQKGIESGRLL